MNEKILIVDREADILKTLETILTQEGYRVRSAAGCEEAFDFINSETFQLVVADIRMPEMSGLEFIKQIKKLDDDMEVIVLTGFASVDNAVQALRDTGAVDFITKPLENVDQLLISIDRAMQKQKLHRKNSEHLKTLEKAKKDLEFRDNELTAELAELYEKVQSESPAHRKD